MPLDSAISQCRQQAEHSIAALRKNLTTSLNTKQIQCQRSLKLSADSKTTYVDNGLGGLMLIDDDFIADQCTPSRQDLAKLEAQVAREQDELLTLCMQSKGYQRLWNDKKGLAGLWYFWTGNSILRPQV